MINHKVKTSILSFLTILIICGQSFALRTPPLNFQGNGKKSAYCGWKYRGKNTPQITVDKIVIHKSDLSNSHGDGWVKFKIVKIETRSRNYKRVAESIYQSFRLTIDGLFRDVDINIPFNEDAYEIENAYYYYHADVDNNGLKITINHRDMTATIDRVLITDDKIPDMFQDKGIDFNDPDYSTFSIERQYKNPDKIWTDDIPCDFSNLQPIIDTAPSAPHIGNKALI